MEEGIRKASSHSYVWGLDRTAVGKGLTETLSYRIYFLSGTLKGFVLLQNFARIRVKLPRSKSERRTNISRSRIRFHAASIQREIREQRGVDGTA